MQRMNLRLEKRGERRRHRSDAISWRLRASDRTHLALLLESSDTGYAFAWRGAEAPIVDALIQLDLKPNGNAPTSVLTRVRRVTRVHDDLVVIAAEIWDPQNTQSAAATRSLPEPRACEYKPRVRQHLLSGVVRSLHLDKWLDVEPKPDRVAN